MTSKLYCTQCAAGWPFDKDHWFCGACGQPAALLSLRVSQMGDTPKGRLDIYADQLFPPLPTDSIEDDEFLEDQEQFTPLEEELIMQSGEVEADPDDSSDLVQKTQIVLTLKNIGSLPLWIDELTIVDQYFEEQTVLQAALSGSSAPKNKQKLDVHLKRSGQDEQILIGLYGSKEDFEELQVFRLKVTGHTKQKRPVSDEILVQVLPNPDISIDGLADIYTCGGSAILSIPLKLKKSRVRISTCMVSLTNGKEKASFLYYAPDSEPSGYYDWDTDRNPDWNVQLKTPSDESIPYWLMASQSPSLDQAQQGSSNSAKKLKERILDQVSPLVKIIDEAEILLISEDESDRQIQINESLGIVEFGDWNIEPSILKIATGDSVLEKVQLQFRGNGQICHVEPEADEYSVKDGGSGLLPSGSIRLGLGEDLQSIIASFQVDVLDAPHGRKEQIKFGFKYRWKHPDFLKEREKSDDVTVEIMYFDRSKLEPVVGIDYGARTSCVYGDHYNQNFEFERPRYTMDSELLKDDWIGSPIPYPKETTHDKKRQLNRQNHQLIGGRVERNTSNFDSVLLNRTQENCLVIGKEAEKEWEQPTNTQVFAPMKPHLGTRHHEQYQGGDASARDLVAYFYEVILQDLSSGSELGSPPKILVLTHPVSMNLKAKYEVYQIDQYLNHWIEEQQELLTYHSNTTNDSLKQKQWSIKHIDEATAVAFFFNAFKSILVQEQIPRQNLPENNEYVLVVDVGASSTDISAVHVTPSSDGSHKIETVEVDGDSQFGGNNLTAWVARKLFQLCQDGDNSQVEDFPVWDETGCTEWFQTYFPELPIFESSSRSFSGIGSQDVSKINSRNLFYLAEPLKLAILTDLDGKDFENFNRFIYSEAGFIPLLSLFSVRGDKKNTSLKNFSDHIDFFKELSPLMARHVDEIIRKVERIYLKLKEAGPNTDCWLILSGQGAKFKLFKETIANNTHLNEICLKNKFVDLASTQYAKNCVAIGAWIYGHYLRETDGDCVGETDFVDLKNTLQLLTYPIGRRRGFNWEELLPCVSVSETKGEWTSSVKVKTFSKLSIYERQSHGPEVNGHFNEETDVKLGDFIMEKGIYSKSGDKLHLKLWVDEKCQLLLEVQDGADHTYSHSLFEDHPIPSSQVLFQ